MVFAHDLQEPGADVSHAVTRIDDVSQLAGPTDGAEVF